jgi:hypothetical protein
MGSKHFEMRIVRYGTARTLEKELRHAADLLTLRNVAVQRAARALAREPASPVTRTLKLWGDDENPFRHLIASKTAEARVWRQTMGLLLGNLAPDPSGRTVWRGWNFASAADRRKLLRKLEMTGRFVNERVGMSASRSRQIAIGPEFVNRHGALWEIRRPRSARDLAPIFRAIGAKCPAQREVIFPHGTRFCLLKPPGWVTLRRDGQAIQVRHYVLEENHDNRSQTAGGPRQD